MMLGFEDDEVLQFWLICLGLVVQCFEHRWESFLVQEMTRNPRELNSQWCSNYFICEAWRVSRYVTVNTHASLQSNYSLQAGKPKLHTTHNSVQCRYNAGR